jgi:bifunctional ADP-heptose synthase (sugar kinase/adenylyltransferase)
MNNVISNGEDFLSRMQGKKVLVIGDLMIDQYIWGEVSRVSPEAPVPVVGVKQETLRFGGAANVVNNVISLGGAVEICGIAGDDLSAGSLMEAIEVIRANYSLFSRRATEAGTVLQQEFSSDHLLEHLTADEPPCD